MSSAAPRAQPKNLLSIAWPIFIEQALRILVGTVDVFMVSHISDGAVAALGVAHQIVILFLIVFNFIAIGASVVITHHLGARDRAGADHIATTAISVNTWMGVAVSLCVFAFAAPMLRLMQLPGDLMPFAVPFLTLMGGTLFMESMNMSISAVLRAHHHTRDAMLVTLGQNIINFLAVCTALFGWFGFPKMGVLGVALASVFSRCCACIALWILLDYRTKLRLRARNFLEISRQRVRRILHIGLPAAGEHLSYWLALMVVTSFIARLGGEALAIQSYTLQVQRLVMVFSVALGLGTEILIGHMVGAGDFERAYHELLKSLRLGFTIAIGAAIVVALAAPAIVHVFTPTADIIAGAALLLRLSVLIEPGRVFNIVVINSLRATGDARFPVQIGAVCMWFIWVPLAWLLGLKLGFGLVGFWISMAVDEWLRGIIMYRRWKLRQWLPFAKRSRAQALSESVGANAAAA
ncbi:MATE family efflux transporter [Opitutus terrae]|uniref:MATE efflux family protein n=1 Tax=Opitutus terrae (strain DSM 11246 / JCM 15787 / PB90-1) TaxID=452637 RepID=B1ZYD7_OPITP|nr:MATE family efflux transporter [Opitutus terrae]ACB77035.1 MATE efflux family protein [Opitutus terrae PB90-1]